MEKYDIQKGDVLQLHPEHPRFPCFLIVCTEPKPWGCHGHPKNHRRFRYDRIKNYHKELKLEQPGKTMKEGFILEYEGEDQVRIILNSTMPMEDFARLVILYSDLGYKWCLSSDGRKGYTLSKERKP